MTTKEFIKKWGSKNDSDRIMKDLEFLCKRQRQICANYATVDHTNGGKWYVDEFSIKDAPMP
ncbi:MAG: hypothetical protein FWC41_07250 [Firmicutes bacterium]|nr:hypothetical protein [Bacillota bacterium]